MTETKFHIEDWMSHYKATLDEDDLRETIEYDDCCRVHSIALNGEVIKVECYNGVDIMRDISITDETGRDKDIEVYAGVGYLYDVDFTIGDVSSRIDTIEEALNAAIEAGASTFIVSVPCAACEVYNYAIDGIEVYEGDVAENDVREDITKAIAHGLTTPNHGLKLHTDDAIMPPSDKEVKFICTIPAE